MSMYIENSGAVQDNIIFLSKGKSRRYFMSRVSRMRLYLALSPFVFLISPVVGVMLILMCIAEFYVGIFREFISHPKRFERYYEMFRPKVDDKVLSVVGYAVDHEDLESHLSLVKSHDAKRMAEKQKQMMTPVNKSKWVGFGKKTLTTHVIMCGKTGSGKTEGIRSISDDVMRNGGGFMFNDGKSDEKMLGEVYAQAKKAGRETSFAVLNYLKAEKMSETNTLNPIGIMHPLRAVEFLGSLVHKEGGDGNKEYFFNRGKAMLAAPTTALSIRRELTGEPFDFERIMDNTNIKDLAILNLLFYCMVRDLNEVIKQDVRVQGRLAGFRRSDCNEYVREVHTLIDYITQRPQERKIFEEYLRLEYRLIKETYNNAYTLMKGYLSGVWNQYDTYLDVIGRIIYAKAKVDGKIFFSNKKRDELLSFEAFKKVYYYEIKDRMSDEDNMRTLYAEISSFDNWGSKDFLTARDGFHRKKGSGGNIEEIPDDAVQQHSYAQQQWGELTGIFAMYKHIFGQTKSEVEPRKLLLDNKILYNLIPILELSDSYIQIIGKISVMMIKEVAAIALGGEHLSVHKTLKSILKDKMTPKPFSLVVLDEYGSYPIAGIDKLLMQLRSLNISVVLGVQNYAGLKTGGNDTTSQENALSNALKWFLKIEDEQSIKWIKEMTSEEHVLVDDLQRDARGDIVSTDTTRIEKRRSFDPEKLRDFENGFSIVLAGNSKDGIIPMQSFYRGGKTVTMHIKRFEPIEF